MAKFVVRGETPKTPVVELWLETNPSDGTVELKAQRQGDEFEWIVADLTADGYLRRADGIAEELSEMFRLDAKGRIRETES